MSNRNLRVHAVVDSLTYGGAELLLAEFAAAAPEAGIELSVAYLRERDGSPGVPRLRELGVEPTLVEIPGHLYPSALTRVRTHLAAARPDLVHTHLGYADLLGGIAARSLGIPSVSTIHAMEFPSRSSANGDMREYAKQRMMGLARRRCAARVIAVSDGARDSYLATGWDRPERVVTVKNGIGRSAQPGAGRAVRAQLGLGPDDLVVATLAGLRAVKAQDVAVDAVHELRDRFPRLRLLVVGEGDCRAELERSAAALGDRVIFAGYRDDPMAVLDAVDVLVHPSRADAFPTTLIEAMAAGVPIVATAVGGIPEIVEDGATGVLLEPPPDPRRLAAAVAGLLDDRGARRALGEAGQARFLAGFDAASWAGRTRVVYDSVLSGG